MIEAVDVLIFFPLIMLITLCIYKLIAFRKGGNDGQSLVDPARRLYFYIISGVGLSMLVNGLEQSLVHLIGFLVPSSLLETSPERAALGISLLVIGGPLWILYWQKINREVLKNPDELTSGIRIAYLLLCLSVSFAISISSISDLISETLQASEFNWPRIPTLIIWLLVWSYHLKMLLQAKPSNHVSSQSLRNTFVYSFSFIGLFILASSLSSLIYLVVFNIIQNTVDNGEILISNDRFSSLRLTMSVLIGFAAWSVHWLILRNKLVKQEYEPIYLYLIYMVTIVSLMVSSTMLLMTLFGKVFQIEEMDGWRFMLISSISTLSIGAAVLLYHTKHVPNNYQMTDLLKKPNAALIFSLAFLGLGFLSAGFSVLIHSVMISLLQLSWTDIVHPDDFWKGPLSGGVSLAIVGCFVWYTSWSRLTMQTASFNEKIAYSRIYFMVVLGISIIVTAGAMAGILFILVKYSLANDLGFQTIESLITPLSVAIVLGVVVIYHRRIFKDIALESEPTIQPQLQGSQTARKSVTIFSQADNRELIKTLQERLDYDVEEIVWTAESNFDGKGIKADIDDLYNSLSKLEAGNILLIQAGQEYKIYTYKRNSLEG
tara:strand:- start:1171 stop:2976 length:1806 start_codon:yes stop_codon:yes gene_type:complete